MKELLPCPMCGGKAKYVVADVPKFKHRVECTKCKLMTRGTAFQNDDYNADDWNKRHTPDDNQKDMVSVLKKLRNSISGDCYVGEEKELELIDSIIVKNLSGD